MFRQFTLALSLIVVLAGCGNEPGPLINTASISANPSGNAPLAALCQFTTDIPTIPEIIVDTGSGTYTVPATDEYKTEHSVVILGLLPDTMHTVTVGARSESGALTEAGPYEVSTPPLPDDLPPLDIKVAKTDKMEPGVHLIPIMKWKGPQMQNEYGMLLIADSTGKILWYYQRNHPVIDAWRLPNGNFVYSRGRKGELYEVDMLGNIQKRWHTTGIPKEVPDSSIPVDTDTIHHDFTKMPNGNYLVLSAEIRDFPDWHTSTTDLDAPKEDTTLIGDIILEFQPDGTIVRQLKMFDILDPYRISHDSLDKYFWANVYKDVLDNSPTDWAHANSIFYDASDDSAIVSFYHQDAVIKFDLDTGEIKWILGDHGNWKAPWSDKLLTPKGELEWNFHQHSAKLTPEGTLILFDNGTHRSLPPNPKMKAEDSYSRAVEYKIDEENMTVEQLWYYGGPDGERFFSPFISEVDWMPETENILITDGGHVTDSKGNPSASPIGGKHWARIVEVTRDSPSEKVFELVIDDEAPNSWSLYRTERLKSLYPDGDE